MFTTLPHFHLYYVASYYIFLLLVTTFSLMFLLLPFPTLFLKFLYWYFRDVLGVLYCHFLFFVRGCYGLRKFDK